MNKREPVILTFDLEHWYNSEFLKKYLPEDKSRLQVNTRDEINSLLAMLRERKSKATFFVLTDIVVKFPELIKKINREGHEIASHGSSHKILTRISEKDFEEELTESINEIEKIIGKKPIGFRAPTFSLNNQSKWLIEILKKYNFKYDSSIFPFYNHLYGNPKAINKIYKISERDVFNKDDESEIVEFPVCVYGEGAIRFPIPGGFYFRFIPLWLFKFLLAKSLKKTPAVLYFHPHELFNFIPKIKIPAWKKKLKYWGVKQGLNKLSKLLKSSGFEFISAKDYLNKYYDKN